ncbi:hypothetical protein H180DRAFT_00486 [Streptomyces sp. WMMB 322]|nr:hypothetical protein H180DRAFT_00486 [Streptomyces sp. WMMB 322]
MGGKGPGLETSSCPPSPTDGLGSFAYCCFGNCPRTPRNRSRDRLGHRDPSVTLRVYAHVIRDRAADIASVFERTMYDENAGQ